MWALIPIFLILEISVFIETYTSQFIDSPRFPLKAVCSHVIIEQLKKRVQSGFRLIQAFPLINPSEWRLNLLEQMMMYWNYIEHLVL